MKSITVLLTSHSTLILRILDAEAVRVDDNGYLHVGSVGVFSPAGWQGVYETEKGTL